MIIPLFSNPTSLKTRGLEAGAEYHFLGQMGSDANLVSWGLGFLEGRPCEGKGSTQPWLWELFGTLRIKAQTHGNEEASSPSSSTSASRTQMTSVARACPPAAVPKHACSSEDALAPTCLLGDGFALCPYFLLDPKRAALLASLRMDTKSSKRCLLDQKVEVPSILLRCSFRDSLDFWLGSYFFRLGY